MAQEQTTLMDPPIEGLLEKVDSKFTLVALAARRARQVNSYYNSLGEGLGVVVPAPGGLAVGQATVDRLRGGGRGEGHVLPPGSRGTGPGRGGGGGGRAGAARGRARAGASRPICRSRRMAPTSRPFPGSSREGMIAPAQDGASRTGEWPMPSPTPGRPPMVVLGVSAGIAAYKSVEVCRRLVDAGVHVVPVLTERATRFVGRATFDALGSERAQVGLFDGPDPIPHTRLGQRADLVVVAPATADLLARYAGGFADDLLTATLVATPGSGAGVPGHAHRDVGAPGRPAQPRDPPGPWGPHGAAGGRSTGRRGRRRGPDGRAGGDRDPGARPTGRRPERDGKPRRAKGTRPVPTSPGSGWWCRRAALVNPSIRSASSRTGRRGSKAMPWPRRPDRRGADVVLVSASDRPVAAGGRPRTGGDGRRHGAGHAGPGRSVPTWW